MADAGFGTQPPGSPTAVCDVCPCCKTTKHDRSKGPSITEDQYYGLEPVTLARGKTVAPYPPLKQKFIKDARARCPELFGQGDCKAYFVASAEETGDSRDIWKGDLGDEARTGIGAVAGDEVSHRTPLNAGGCPIGKGNLTNKSKLSEQCQTVDNTITTYQGDRIARLRGALS